MFFLLEDVPVKLNDFTVSHSRGGDIENAGDDPQVPGPTYKWAARLLVQHFCISAVGTPSMTYVIAVPCIKNIQEQKEMHHQANKLLKCLCERVRSLNDSNAYDSHINEAIYRATKLGIHEVIEEIVESFPIFAMVRQKDGWNLFQMAVIERHANVFNLIHQMEDFRTVIVSWKDDFGNNLLHLAGRRSPQNKLNLISGAALQMQRELQWFQVIVLCLHLYKSCGYSCIVPTVCCQARLTGIQKYLDWLAIMLANKKPRTSYAQLPQETKDKRNHRRRELDGNLTEVSRAKRNERRRLSYANLPNIYGNLPESIKDKKNERRRQLRLEKDKNHEESIQSVCNPVSYGNECQEMVRTMVPAQTGHPTNLEVVIEAVSAGTIPTDQNGTQTPVARVIREVSSSSLTDVSRVNRNERHRLSYTDLQNIYATIPESIRNKHNDRRKQLRLEKEKTHEESTQSFCTPDLSENACQEIVPNMVLAQSAHPTNSEVVIDAVPAEAIPKDGDRTQPYVCGTVREVSRSSIHACTTSTHEIGKRAPRGQPVPVRSRPIPNEAFVLPIVLQCIHCDAKRFASEPDGFCCSKGQVSVYPLRTPAKLLELFRGSSKLCKDFRTHIRPYNNMFAFTSFGVTLDPRYTKNHQGIYTFRAQGQIYHFMHSLYPANGKPSYLQLYFYDTAKEVEHRSNCLDDLDSDTITQLIDILKPNPYSKFFRSLATTPNIDSYQIRLRADPIVDDKTFNAPTASQVALIWKDNEDDSELRERDILVEKHDGHSVTIKHYYGCYDPLQYPLLFPYGEPGWHRGIKRNSSNKRANQLPTHPLARPNASTTVEQLLNTESQYYEETSRKQTMVSAREFYAYQFQIRPKIDSIILESEITNELKSHEDVQNRPDLVTRVFKGKLEHMKKEVIKKKLFGPVQAYTYVIEFQKRGLPHVHLLLILKKGHKLTAPEHFDQFISAEIPDENENPHLYGAVLRHMMHGPCGKLNPSNVCMKNGKCKNHYPKKFIETTTVAADGYPIYRRRNDNKQVQVRRQMLDNRWVVPYNPYLLAMLDCHVNVELCSTVKAVKYLYKYIYKGHDKIIFKIIAQSNEVVDEITQFQTARWVTPPEAMWRIYKFNLFDMQPSVIALQLHLENCQVVGFRKTTNLDSVADSEFFSRTMLTQFFSMNMHNKKAKKGKYLYKDFPTEFVWSTQTRYWTERQHKNVIGRIITINPSQGELYYLRLLLNHIPCPTSYSYLRTVGGKTYSTYREAALAHGLLVDDKGNEKCLEEACGYQMPNSLRQLFCTILVFCGALNPKELLLKFEEPLTEDYVKKQKMLPIEARQCLLRFVKSKLESMGKTMQDFGLDDLLADETQHDRMCKEILDEQDIDVSELDLLSISKLNSDQSKAYSEILQAVRKKDGTCFFIDGPGGTGKTFLYRALLATIRSARNIALATATSGVAASILPSGRTAHSRFKIPLERDGKLTCNVGKQTGLAKLLRATSLIIWDEASMAKRQIVEALDNLLRDITEVDSLFGGKVVVLGGDFRQVLPVIPKGTKDDCIDASLVRSYIWPYLKKFTLKENMRARTDPAFSSYLLRVGNGEEPCNSNDEITIPPSMIIPPNQKIAPIEQLIAFVFPNLRRYSVDAISMTQSAILAPRNDSVDQTNELLINRFPGKEYMYTSIDEAVNPADQGLYVDFMHSVCPPGLPAHRLVLKENCPVMMLRNLDPSKGLCNGTRLICRKLHKHVIMAEIAIGEHQGDIVFIPRISLQPADAKLYPVQFTRRQFPIRLCFAMTINKAQGQTLDIVGVNLQQPVFSHGQLYVALSRATTAPKIKVILDTSYDGNNIITSTKNIVYGEILREAHSNPTEVDLSLSAVSRILNTSKRLF
ncbi:hypothetical protein RHGRI_037973 [Rhododendron griersonianum]|uniref:ATP-dependent DNA helicase n=1 Tax=Rhododendron griersonianum TaxID=479676 RepID=A0AAV6HTT6_9ERIC|nr:hypothetical protein RHGRI_037973 [Rhododendron griersonianum]